MYNWNYRFYVLIIVLVSLSYASIIGTGGHKGVARTISGQTLGKTGLNGGASFKFNYGKSFVKYLSKSGQPVDASVVMLSYDAYVGYGLLEYLDVAIDFPMYADLWERADKNKTGVGDLGFSFKFGNPSVKRDAVVNTALLLKANFSTGNSTSGYFPHSMLYLGDDSLSTAHSSRALMVYSAIAAWSADFSQINPKATVKLHANTGMSVSANSKTSYNSVFRSAFAVEYAPIPLVNIFSSFTTETETSYFRENVALKQLLYGSMLTTLGFDLRFKNGLYTSLSMDLGISSDSEKYRVNWIKTVNDSIAAYSTKRTPLLGFQLAVGWEGRFVERDYDKDGIPDSKDRCPEQPEDKDNYEDSDGCPDKIHDTDNDGIPDDKDKCPEKPATCDGCPVVDQDSDGVLDKEDQCPQTAEDKDGFEDYDGCPDTDNDNDGILDVNDKCPDKPEDSDGFEDSDGCPDLDNDADGIPDASDKCPNLKGFAGNGGCPNKTQKLKRKLTLSGVTFRSGKAQLTTNSFTILDKVAESLLEWKEVKVEIHGHTDSQGSASYNLQISQKRAESVRQYLIRKGVEPHRLIAIGHGEDQPVATNSTAAGREQNRRVELHRID